MSQFWSLFGDREEGKGTDVGGFRADRWAQVEIPIHSAKDYAHVCFIITVCIYPDYYLDAFSSYPLRTWLPSVYRGHDNWYTRGASFPVLSY